MTNSPIDEQRYALHEFSMDSISFSFIYLTLQSIFFSSSTSLFSLHLSASTVRSHGTLT